MCFLFVCLFVCLFFTVKLPSVTQRSVSQENAFKTTKVGLCGTDFRTLGPLGIAKAGSWLLSRNGDLVSWSFAKFWIIDQNWSQVWASGAKHFHVFYNGVKNVSCSRKLNYFQLESWKLTRASIGELGVLQKWREGTYQCRYRAYHLPMSVPPALLYQSVLSAPPGTYSQHLLWGGGSPGVLTC